MMRFFILGICLLLAGCFAGNPTKPPAIPLTVTMPVAVSCIEQLPERPKLHTDTELKAMDDYTLAVTLLVDRIRREIYESQLEAALEGCK